MVITMKYEDKIRNILQNSISFTKPMKDIGTNDDLQQMGMNSISFIKAVVQIEDEFDIEFPDERLVISRVHTIRELCNIVIELLDDDHESKISKN